MFPHRKDLVIAIGASTKSRPIYCLDFRDLKITRMGSNKLSMMEDSEISIGSLATSTWMVVWCPVKDMNCSITSLEGLFGMVVKTCFLGETIWLWSLDACGTQAISIWPRKILISSWWWMCNLALTIHGVNRNTTWMNKYILFAWQGQSGGAGAVACQLWVL